MAHADAALERRLSELVGNRLGRRVARIEWLSGQLGLRRFARLTLDAGEPLMLVARVDAAEDPAGRPSGSRPEPALEPIRSLLASHGLPVPRRYAADELAGIELLEDVGDVSLRDAALRASAGERGALYREACELIPLLQRIGPTAVAAFDRRLDAELFDYKAQLFARCGLALRGRESTPAETAAVRSAFAAVARSASAAPARLAHRDFQSLNLHVVAGRPPGARLVMIDLQGAFLAPPEYDLVCLLRDSYVELEPSELRAQLDRVRSGLPDMPDPETFAHRFDLLTLTRKGKDLGRFVQTSCERGDHRFLQYVPATVRALRGAACRAARRDPAFGSLAELVESLPESSEDPSCGQ
jgi:hypothetical protein